MSDEPVARQREVRVYRNAFVEVFDDHVRFPDGRAGRHVRIVESGGRRGACALLVRDGLVGLVRVYRYPLAQWEWGIPRGFGQDVSTEVTIRAELMEETGIEPTDLRPLGTVAPNSGLLATLVDVYVAAASSAGQGPLDSAEIAEVKWVGVQELLTDVAEGRVIDGFTLAALALALSRRALPGL